MESPKISSLCQKPRGAQKNPKFFLKIQTFFQKPLVKSKKIVYNISTSGEKW